MNCSICGKPHSHSLDGDPYGSFWQYAPRVAWIARSAGIAGSAHPHFLVRYTKEGKTFWSMTDQRED